MFDIYNECYEAQRMEKKLGYGIKEVAEEYGIPEKLYRNFKKTGRIEPQCEADNLLFLPRPIRPKRFLKEARMEAHGEQSVNEAAFNLRISVDEYIRFYNAIAAGSSLPARPESRGKKAEAYIIPRAVPNKFQKNELGWDIIR